MSQNNTRPDRYRPRSFELVLDFCVELSRRMIMSGANVERVNPAIIPLIPGDLFFYTLIGINQKNSEMVRTNGFDCALTLVSMSVGFALSFAIAHYVRKAKNK